MIMDRCIVEGCATGSPNDTNNTKQHLLFKVPNDPEVLDTWCVALGQVLEPGDKVCDNHFKEDDILKNLSTFTKVEGQKTVTFKKRVKLKRDAIPIPPVRQDPLEIEDSDCIIEDEPEEHLLEDEVQNYDDVDESDTYSHQLTNGDGEEESERYNKGENILHPITLLQEGDEEDIISIPSEDDFQEVVQESTQLEVVSNYKKNGATKNRETEKPIQKRKVNQLFSQKNKLSELGILPEEECITQNKIRKTMYSYGPSKPFSCFDELKYVVQHRCIRQQWCAKVEHSCVFFYYVDFDVAKVNCCLRLDEDFKANAYTADKVIAIYVATTDGVRSVSEIIEIMKVLEKKRWCIGPGIPTVSRSADCIGAMPVKSVSDSCSACMKEKLDSLSHTRELANCRIKLDESRHKYEKMRKKHHYANTQYERLKAENRILEFQIDEAKKFAINDVLDRLPELQQCVVRYIIHASYAVKSALRYSDTWFHECNVMRAMSSSLYEYMRNKGILPLPCLDTLKKHKFRTASTDKVSNSDAKTEESILPDIMNEIPDPVIVIKAAEDCELPVIAEAMYTNETSEILNSIDLPEPTELLEKTEIPESTNPNDYGVVEISPDCIISEDFAYEVTVSTEANDEQQN